MEAYVSFDFLPDVAPTVLREGPLKQVVAQVRMNAQGSLATQAGAAELQELLADYPRLLSEQQASITATPAGVSTTQVPQWRLTDLEGLWSVVVGPEHLTLETTAYTTWDSFSSRLDSAVRALSEHSAPRVRERVGLRYVNNIAPLPDGSFQGRVNPLLLGLAAEAHWRAVTRGSLAQTVASDGSKQIGLRAGYGAAVTDDDSFIVDADCFDESPSKFEAEEIVKLFNELNVIAYRCFAYCIPDEYRSILV